MSVGIEIAFSLDDGRMTKVKSTAKVETADQLRAVLDGLYADARARVEAVLDIDAPVAYGERTGEVWWQNDRVVESRLPSRLVREDEWGWLVDPLEAHGIWEPGTPRWVMKDQTYTLYVPDAESSPVADRLATERPSYIPKLERHESAFEMAQRISKEMGIDLFGKGK